MDHAVCALAYADPSSDPSAMTAALIVFIADSSEFFVQTLSSVDLVNDRAKAYIVKLLSRKNIDKTWTACRFCSVPLHTLVVRNQLRAIFDYRTTMITERFNAATPFAITRDEPEGLFL